MCCGQKRSALRSAAMPVTKPADRQGTPDNPRPSSLPQMPAPTRTPGSAVSLRYLENQFIRVRGPVTGTDYEFSGSHPIQRVDRADALALLHTRLFRQT